MPNYLSLSKENWANALDGLLEEYLVYAPIKLGEVLDYELITKHSIENISYNTSKPTTPLKLFFNPYSQNVTSNLKIGKPRIIIGVPSCDLEAIGILDEIYLGKDFTDQYYLENKESTILIGSDCYSYDNNCHCTTYNIMPYPQRRYDLSISAINHNIILEINSDKGKLLIDKISQIVELKEVKQEYLEQIYLVREQIKKELVNKNKYLPDYSTTQNIVDKISSEIWGDHASGCVSCGACSAICPTCTCFLLIDRPGFEKVKQTDTCQHPAFEKVAAGEDPLKTLSNRLSNRHFCKYIWKKQKFTSLPCTGCGRCIEACIGKINKNELFIELNK